MEGSYQFLNIYGTLQKHPAGFVVKVLWNQKPGRCLSLTYREMGTLYCLTYEQYSMFCFNKRTKQSSSLLVNSTSLIAFVSHCFCPIFKKSLHFILQQFINLQWLTGKLCIEWLTFKCWLVCLYNVGMACLNIGTFDKRNECGNVEFLNMSFTNTQTTKLKLTIALKLLYWLCWIVVWADIETN